MKIWNLSASFAAVLLCVICLALPIAQWATIPTETWAQVLAGVTALALGVCKLSFFPLGWAQLAQRKVVPGFCLLGFAVLLLAITVDASRDLLDNQTIQRQQVQQQDSLAYQTLGQKLNSLNAQIETYNGLLAADQRGNFRERAYSQSENLQILEAQRDKVLIKLTSLPETSSQAAQSSFGVSIDGMIGGDYKGFISGSFFTALAIHLGCVLAVMAVSVWNLPELGSPSTPAPNKPTSTPEPKASKKIKPETKDPGPFTDEQLKLAVLILAGEFGNQPSVKAVIAAKAIKGGHPKVSPVFEHLIDTKSLMRVGQRYQLVQTNLPLLRNH